MSAVPQSRPADGRPAIEIKGLNKWYGEFHVLKDIDLTVARGEKIVICGPSGSGKSTLIRCINRLEQHQQGSIVVNGIALLEGERVIALRESDDPRQHAAVLLAVVDETLRQAGMTLGELDA
ncbi:MAG TPA: ATP-binding cassette domain-containing protein, partial [Burkholderiaceae bacterium]|nr:ATP-binding cassette domain-containing protein [Burkholderiaceae bacterium]